MLMKPYVLERIEAAWNVWLYSIDGIPADRCAEAVAGDWSIKDLLGHTAFWDLRVAEYARRRSAGEEVSPVDFQPMNEADFSANSGRTLQFQRQRMFDTHAELLRCLESLPEVDPDWVEGDTWLHYVEHACLVIAWRQAEGFERQFRATP